MAKILVIDDSEIIRDLLREFLSEGGHDVTTAVDGDEGIDLALRESYDLCFCDMHLPKKSGAQVFEALEHHNDSMQFVFTDSMPDRHGEELRRETGYEFLRKPFDLDEVRRVLDRALSKSSDPA